MYIWKVDVIKKFNSIEFSIINVQNIISLYQKYINGYHLNNELNQIFLEYEISEKWNVRS